jgi:hypothetical protein
MLRGANTNDRRVAGWSCVSITSAKSAEFFELTSDNGRQRVSTAPSRVTSPDDVRSVLKDRLDFVRRCI